MASKSDADLQQIEAFKVSRVQTCWHQWDPETAVLSDPSAHLLYQCRSDHHSLFQRFELETVKYRRTPWKRRRKIMNYLKHLSSKASTCSYKFSFDVKQEVADIPFRTIGALWISSKWRCNLEVITHHLFCFYFSNMVKLFKSIFFSHIFLINSLKTCQTACSACHQLWARTGNPN